MERMGREVALLKGKIGCHRLSAKESGTKMAMSGEALVSSFGHSCRRRPVPVAPCGGYLCYREISFHLPVLQEHHALEVQIPGYSGRTLQRRQFPATSG